MLLFVRKVALAVLLSIAAATPAAAQSFFQKLFGWTTPQSQPPPQLPPPVSSYRAPLHLPQSHSQTNEHEERAPRGSGQVRTMCVRMCDGYYFPISHKISIRHLTADSDRCKATCGNDAKLFYGYDDGTDPGAMVDFTGRRYDALDTAFAYRKALRPGCTCKPPPWSASERLRHFSYALKDAQEEAKAVAQGEGQPTVVGEHVAASATDTDAKQHEPAAERSKVPSTIAAGEAATHRVSARSARSERSVRLNEDLRPHTNPRPKVTRAESNQPAGGFFGLGQSPKYVWPGDGR